MNLLQQLKDDKVTVIAFHALAQEMANNSSVNLKSNLKSTCASALVNRTQIYEKKSQIANSLEAIELSGRGRPSIPITAIDQQNSDQLRVKIKVLEYRLEHPGCFIRHSSARTTYSDGFRRFILVC